MGMENCWKTVEQNLSLWLGLLGRTEAAELWKKFDRIVEQ